MSPPEPASVTFTCDTAELDDEILVTVSGILDIAAAAVPMTAATSSALIATILLAVPGSTIRVQAS